MPDKKKLQTLINEIDVDNPKELMKHFQNRLESFQVSGQLTNHEDYAKLAQKFTGPYAPFYNAFLDQQQQVLKKASHHLEHSQTVTHDKKGLRS